MKILASLGLLMALTASATWADTAAASDPSNSANNKTNGVTATDQSNTRSDVDITAAIRRRLTKDDRLSTDAKNVKVVTVGGKVTLAGPVDTDQEKKIVGHYAAKVAGHGNVDNQLTVK